MGTIRLSVMTKEALNSAEFKELTGVIMAIEDLVEWLAPEEKGDTEDAAAYPGLPQVTEQTCPGGC